MPTHVLTFVLTVDLPASTTSAPMPSRRLSETTREDGLIAIQGDGDFFTPRQVAEILHTKESTLASDRSLGRGLAYTRMGRRILYPRAALIAALKAGPLCQCT